MIGAGLRRAHASCVDRGERVGTPSALPTLTFAFRRRLELGESPLVVGPDGAIEDQAEIARHRVEPGIGGEAPGHARRPAVRRQMDPGACVALPPEGERHLHQVAGLEERHRHRPGTHRRVLARPGHGLPDTFGRTGEGVGGRRIELEPRRPFAEAAKIAGDRKDRRRRRGDVDRAAHLRLTRQEKRDHDQRGENDGNSGEDALQDTNGCSPLAPAQS